MIYIYALVDPVTKQIRYIGKSIRPKERLQNHCADRSVTYRTNWIKQVMAAGKRPELLILEQLPDQADWKEAERKWIADGKRMGLSLTNCTSGGDGVPDLPAEIRKRIASVWLGRKHTPEELEKMSKASLGRTHDEAWKTKMSAKMKGRKILWTDKIRQANQKLTDDQVRQIRNRLSCGESQYKLADVFHVHQGTICNIKRGVSYGRVK